MDTDGIKMVALVSDFKITYFSKVSTHITPRGRERKVMSASSLSRSCHKPFFCCGFFQLGLHQVMLSPLLTSSHPFSPPANVKEFF